MAPISAEKRNNITVALLSGASQRVVAIRNNVSKSFVAKFAKKLTDIPKCTLGRPSKISKHLASNVVRSFKKGDFINAVEASKSLESDGIVSVSPTTIRRVLKSNDMVARKKKKSSPLSKSVKRKRMAFARKYGDWTVYDWERVVFADEVRINRFGCDGKNWVWGEKNKPRRPHEYYDHPKFGGGGVTFWGCITAKGVGYLSKIDGNMDTALFLDIMNDEYKQTLDWYGMDIKKTRLLQDSDPKHMAVAARIWYEKNGVEVLDWPTNSPDLNPIENIWSFLKQELNRIYPEPAKSIEELWNRIEVTWDRPVMNEFAKKVIYSMPKRCALILKNKGGKIGY